MSSKAYSSGPTPTAQAYLTKKNKRDLITLYHNTKDFITPQSLSARIDIAFTSNKHKMGSPQPYAQDGSSEEISYRALRNKVNAMRMNPRTVTAAQASAPIDNYTSDGLWSIGESNVGGKVKQAVLGMDESWSPGLEMVEKYAEESRKLDKGFENE